MKLKKYKGFDNWDEFVMKYEQEDFSTPEARANFRNDFEEISKLMWSYWIENMELVDITEQLAEMWCSGISKEPNMAETYKKAYNYCRYASDRMNVNRWMRIRILLNYDVE